MTKILQIFCKIYFTEMHLVIFLLNTNNNVTFVLEFRKTIYGGLHDSS